MPLNWRKGQQREVWAKTKNISGKSSKIQATSVCDKDGKIITDPHILTRGTGGRSILFRTTQPSLSSVNLTDFDDVPTQPSFGYLICSDRPPTRDEIELQFRVEQFDPVFSGVIRGLNRMIFI